MYFLDLTMPTVADDLALDEALLEQAESSVAPTESLRVWEPTSCVVVVGRSSRLSAEVNLANCRRDGVPVVRRASGGAAIVAGPGCLMYSLVLSLELRPELRDVSIAHRFVLDRMIAAIAPSVPGVKCRGTSDLVIGDRKISGNSLRLRRRNLLYHGTLLYDFPLDMISRYLTMPPRMPDYRGARPHGEFVVNLAVRGVQLRHGLFHAWSVTDLYPDPPLAAARQLAQEKYATDGWNEQLM